VAEDIKSKIKELQDHPCDGCFSTQNQSRNCWQTRDFHCYQRAMIAKGGDAPCAVIPACVQDLCPISWGSTWDDRRAKGTFPGRLCTGSTLLLSLPSLSQGDKGNPAHLVIPPLGPCIMTEVVIQKLQKKKKKG
uniref:Uncharacterized protein n=1 Tax=Oryctolagus cuniculus TaxID=9986 RepID=A0A5F9DQN2_RABIT